jgi:hypothetical protein
VDYHERTPLPTDDEKIPKPPNERKLDMPSIMDSNTETLTKDEYISHREVMMMTNDQELERKIAERFRKERQEQIDYYEG